MSGPEHYKKAEQLAAQSHGQGFEQAAYTVQLAQVHATLALAAATALAPSWGDPEYPATADEIAWDNTAGEKK